MACQPYYIVGDRARESPGAKISCKIRTHRLGENSARVRGSFGVFASAQATGWKNPFFPFGWGATLPRTGRIFLPDEASHSSGIWYDGDISHHFRDGPERDSVRLVRPANLRNRRPDCRRW